MVWFAHMEYNLSKLSLDECNLQVANDLIKPVKPVRYIGALLDKELTMKEDIHKVARVYFFPLAAHTTDSSDCKPLYSNLVVLSCIDYCNSDVHADRRHTVYTLEASSKCGCANRS
jgi:hypothetical protein